MDGPVLQEHSHYDHGSKRTAPIFRLDESKRALKIHLQSPVRIREGEMLHLFFQASRSLPGFEKDFTVSKIASGPAESLGLHPLSARGPERKLQVFTERKTRHVLWSKVPRGR